MCTLSRSMQQLIAPQKLEGSRQFVWVKLKVLNISYY